MGQTCHVSSPAAGGRVRIALEIVVGPDAGAASLMENKPINKRQLISTTMHGYIIVMRADDIAYLYEARSTAVGLQNTIMVIIRTIICCGAA